MLCHGRWQQFPVFQGVDVGVLGFPERVGVEQDGVVMAFLAGFLDSDPVFPKCFELVLREALEHSGDLRFIL